MIGAGQAQKGPLHLRPGRRDDDRAAVLGVLDRGQADAAGGGVDQNDARPPPACASVPSA